MASLSAVPEQKAPHYIPFSPPSLRLADRIRNARVGDWCIQQIDYTTVAWLVRQAQHQFILQEWTVPASACEQNGSDPQLWSQWIRQNQDKPESMRLLWTEAEGWKIWDCTRESWTALEREQSLVGALFSAAFDSVDPAHQRRIGPRPKAGTEDNRPVWRPSLARSWPRVEVWRRRLPLDPGAENTFLLTVWCAPPEYPGFPAIFPVHVEAERAGLRLQCHCLAAGTL
jgi:hypothetical protein